MPQNDEEVIVRYRTRQGIKGQFICNNDQVQVVAADREMHDIVRDHYYHPGPAMYIGAPPVPQRFNLTAPGIRIEVEDYVIERSPGGG